MLQCISTSLHTQTFPRGWVVSSHSRSLINASHWLLPTEKNTAQGCSILYTELLCLFLREEHSLQTRCYCKRSPLQSYMSDNWELFQGPVSVSMCLNPSFCSSVWLYQCGPRGTCPCHSLNLALHPHLAAGKSGWKQGTPHETAPGHLTRTNVILSLINISHDPSCMPPQFNFPFHGASRLHACSSHPGHGRKHRSTPGED